MEKLFTSLQDAGFPNGDIEIWYYNPEYGRDASLGHSWLKDHNILPDVNDLSKTHVLLGKVGKTTGLQDKEQVFFWFQSENWSPMGEARDFITSRGAWHTSMSVGDIVFIDGKYEMVDGCGFVEL